MVGEGLAAREQHLATLAIQRDDLLVGTPVDFQPGIGLGWLDVELFTARLAGQVVLGKRRAPIGRVGFLAEQGDRGAIAALAQCAGDFGPCLSGADDDDAGG
ncbi:hypothetical protein D9M70_633710 [compost metagenome]